MSQEPAHASARCPVCGAALVGSQSWCLACGSAARTRLAPAPRWRMASALVGVIAMCALLAVGFAIAGQFGGSGAATGAPAGAQTAGATGATGASAATGATAATGTTGTTAATSTTGTTPAR